MRGPKGPPGRCDDSTIVGGRAEAEGQVVRLTQEPEQAMKVVCTGR